MNIRIAQTSLQAAVPTYATAGAIACDFTAVIDRDEHKDGVIELRPGEAHTFGTGLIVEVPQGTGLFLFGRSGHGVKQRMRLGNCVGLIDSDYRGEVMVTLTNDGKKVQRVKHGERIAQGVVMPIMRCTFTVVQPDQLTKTDRGAGGHGSTGK